MLRLNDCRKFELGCYPKPRQRSAAGSRPPEGQAFASCLPRVLKTQVGGLVFLGQDFRDAEGMLRVLNISGLSFHICNPLLLAFSNQTADSTCTSGGGDPTAACWRGLGQSPISHWPLNLWMQHGNRLAVILRPRQGVRGGEVPWPANPYHFSVFE